MMAEDIADGDIALKEIELGDVEKKKVPRRIIHFTNGETMEEYSTEEEDDEDDQRIDFRNVDTTKMSWRTYVQFWILRVATTAFFTCDYLGGRLATLFGLNVPKYQYAIDEYQRTQEEDSDDDEDDDGEIVKDTGDKNALNERHHLQMESMVYGTIQDYTVESRDTYQMDSEVIQSKD